MDEKCGASPKLVRDEHFPSPHANLAAMALSGNVFLHISPDWLLLEHKQFLWMTFSDLWISADTTASPVTNEETDEGALIVDSLEQDRHELSGRRYRQLRHRQLLPSALNAFGHPYGQQGQNYSSSKCQNPCCIECSARSPSLQEPGQATPWTARRRARTKRISINFFHFQATRRSRKHEKERKNERKEMVERTQSNERGKLSEVSPKYFTYTESEWHSSRKRLRSDMNVDLPACACITHHRGARSTDNVWAFDTVYDSSTFRSGFLCFSSMSQWSWWSIFGILMQKKTSFSKALHDQTMWESSNYFQIFVKVVQTSSSRSGNRKISTSFPDFPVFFQVWKKKNEIPDFFSRPAADKLRLW